MRQRATKHNITPPHNSPGGAYVVIELREHDDRVNNWGKIQLRKNPENCGHTETMCYSWDCVELWSIDYRIHFYRTIHGRKLAEALGIPADTEVIGTPGHYVSQEEFISKLSPSTNETEAD